MWTPHLFSVLVTHGGNRGVLFSHWDLFLSFLRDRDPNSDTDHKRAGYWKGRKGADRVWSEPSNLIQSNSQHLLLPAFLAITKTIVYTQIQIYKYTKTQWTKPFKSKTQHLLLPPCLAMEVEAHIAVPRKSINFFSFDKYTSRKVLCSHWTHPSQCISPSSFD